MVSFTKIKPLTIFSEHYILDVWQGSEYVSVKFREESASHCHAGSFPNIVKKMFARIRRLPVPTGSSKHCNMISTGNNVTFFQATWKVQFWENSITSNTVPTWIYTVSQSDFR